MIETEPPLIRYPTFDLGTEYDVHRKDNRPQLIFATIDRTPNMQEARVVDFITQEIAHIERFTPCPRNNRLNQ